MTGVQHDQPKSKFEIRCATLDRAAQQGLLEPFGTDDWDRVKVAGFTLLLSKLVALRSEAAADAQYDMVETLDALTTSLTRAMH